MKKTLLLFTFVALCALCAHAQSTKTGYYFYDGARKEISVNTTALLVYFNKAQISLDEINRIYTVEKEMRMNEQKADSLYAFVISTGNNNYETFIADLKRLPYVFDVEPVIGERGSTLISNRFFVQLNSLSDTSILKNLAEQTMVTYDGVLWKDVEHDFYWYGLSTNKNAGDALQMSIVYGETGLFKGVAPNIVYTIHNNSQQRSNSPGPSDNLISNQWSITDLYDIWAEGIRGNGVKIALIDDGVDTNHYEFDSLSHTSIDIYSGLISMPSEIYGHHGTQMAGVIFSDHSNNDIAGIAPKASLFDISFFSTYYGGGITLDEDFVSMFVTAVSYALSNSNVDIILCPWDYTEISESVEYQNYLMDNTLDYVLNNGRNGKGTIFVFSAGGKGQSDSIVYPAYYDDRFIVVGATRDDHDLSYYSCYGSKLDIVAPGENILTTDSYPSYDYYFISNLSGVVGVASAHVAGVVALMLSANPDLTREQVDWILKHTAYKSPDYTFGNYANHPDGTWNVELGYGEINSARAVEMARDISLTPGLVVKDNGGDNGVEPTAYSTTFNSPSIVAKDATNTYEVDRVSYGSLYNVNVTLHNYGSSSVTIDPADVKLYYHTYSTEQLTWPQSFPYGTYLTPSSTTPVTIAGNGGSQTFVITLDLRNIFPANQTGTWYITFAAVIGDDPNEIHDYNGYNIPFDMFVEGNRLVAGKTYINYEEPHVIIDPELPPHPGINATPNPTDGHTTIGIDIDELPQNAMLVITDMYGNVVVREMLRGTSQEVDLSERPAGNYYVFVNAGDKMIGMNKIVVY